MRIVLTVAMLALVLPAAAFDLGAQAPAKPAAGYQAPPADPDVIRQGGDTVIDALYLPIPATNVVGTTIGYSDDYDEICPYDGSTSPDVVYRLAPQWPVAVDIDMLGSAYDTKIYVYDAAYELVACNDDFYPDYVSKIEGVFLEGGVKYYLVIDGYGGDSGEYLLNIPIYVPCELDCPAGFPLEGEPPLVDGYVDQYNGGCNSQEYGAPFQDLNWGLCGRAGWFIGPDGGNSRDTDWFLMTVPPSGFLEIWGDAEYPTYMFELGPQDCGNAGVIQSVIIGPCSEGSMTIVGAPYSTVWFWVGSTTFEGPVDEYDYLIDTSVYAPPVATEPDTWTNVRGLFR